MSPRLLDLVGRKHPALHRPAETVVDWDQAGWLAARMAVSLKARRGLALAAPQVGHSLALVVVADGTVMANPALVDTAGDPEDGVEGCLSLPGRWFRVPRHPRVTVEAVDLAGGGQRVEARGLDARMWAHEIDHLDGVLLNDRYEEWCETR